MKKRNLHSAYFFGLLLAFTSGSLLAHPSDKSNAFIHSAKVVSDNHHLNIEENYLIRSDKLTVSNLYPNPAFDYVDIDVQINGNFSDVRLIMYNILGQPVKEINLDINQRTVRIQLRDLNPGLYPYQLVVDGKSMATKKLIVK